MNVECTLQDSFLDNLCSQEIKVSIYLLNGIRLEGHIKSFDQYAILLKGLQGPVIYKQAICSIVPSRALKNYEFTMNL